MNHKFEHFNIESYIEEIINLFGLDIDPIKYKDTNKDSDPTNKKIE